VLSKHKGETFDISGMRDMRVLVNGVALFEVKSGKVMKTPALRVSKKRTVAMVKLPQKFPLSTKFFKEPYKAQQSAPKQN